MKRINLIVSVAIILLSLPVIAVKPNCKHDKDTFRCVKYVRNYDGDTITFEIPGVHSLLGKSIGIRVNGVDTPEKRTKDKCEKTLALVAQKLVEGVLKKAVRIDLKNIKRGKYFRVVADVFYDGLSIKDLLIKKGLAYPYDGKTKRKVDWCKSLNQLQQHQDIMY